MKTRKIQLINDSTFTVSLPRQWAIDHNIESGTPVRLYPDGDGSLILDPDSDRISKSVETQLSIDDFSVQDTRRIVHALYAIGLDRSAFSSSGEIESKKRRSISSAATELIGLEVIREIDDSMVLRNLLNIHDTSVTQSVVQLQQLALSMYQDTLEALAENKPDLAGNVIERTDTIDRLFNLISRNFQRMLTGLPEIDQLELNRATMFDYYRTACQLERISSQAKKIATAVQRSDTDSAAEISDDVISSAHQSLTIVEDAINILVSDDNVKKAYRVLTAHDHLSRRFEALDRELHNDNGVSGYLEGTVLDSIGILLECSSNIGGVVIQKESRDGINWAAPDS